MPAHTDPCPKLTPFEMRAMTKTIFVLNGPNLNLLGEREPSIYGSTTLADIRQMCLAKAGSLGFEIDFRQTNFEGELVESIHQARRDACGIIINPAAYTFTSIALKGYYSMSAQHWIMASCISRIRPRGNLS